VGGFSALFLLRLLLGAAESVAYPSYSKIIATRFPEHRRGLTNALIDAGSKAGPALGTLIGGLVVARFGWRALFSILGFGALLWVPLWVPGRRVPKPRASRTATKGRASAGFCGNGPPGARFSGFSASITRFTF